jgi:putative autotransporter adhesin-like protein
MKRSQLALLTAIGAVVVAALALALWVRLVAEPSPEFPTTFSGQRTSRSYDFANFSRVDARGQWQVALVRGDAWSVEVSYPVELEPNLTVNAAGGELDLTLIGNQGDFWSDFGAREGLRVTARVVMPALEKIELAGATKLELSGFQGEELELDAGGAFQITATDSRYDELDLQMAGAGKADLSGLTATDAHVQLAGAQSVTLRMAGGRLSGEVVGASRLEYYGTVASQDVDVAGIARVQRID